MGASDLRVTVDGSKLRCVLDPAFVLGHACGLKLALGLTRVFETWLPRSFWQVLDASELLEAGLPQTGLHPLALSDWTALRDGTDAGSWTLRWVGDNLAESQLRSGGDDSLVDRFEWHAETLLARRPPPTDAHWCRHFDPLAGAHDALALSAALDGALILCRAPDPRATPGPAQVLRGFELPLQELAETDTTSLMAAERAFVRQAIAAAGLATLLQTMQHACVVHALTLPPSGDASNDDSQDPWQCSDAWWYRL